MSMRDYRQASDGDLDLSSGDLRLTDSTYQHQRDLLLSDKGHVRNKAEAGVGMVNYLLDKDPVALLRSTRKEFVSDGMKVRKVTFDSSNELDVEARYEND